VVYDSVIFVVPVMTRNGYK